MAPVSQRSYSEILQDLEAFDSYLKSIGLSRPHDRLRGMIANIRQLERARAENRLLLFNAHPRLVEIVWSLVEGQEFANIFRGLRGYDTEILKPLMEKAVSGPVQPINERETSRIARNTVFELTLGARLRQAGEQVILGEQADVVINHAASNVYIECKRPRDENTIAQNLVKARRQLQQRFM